MGIQLNSPKTKPTQMNAARNSTVHSSTAAANEMASTSHGVPMIACAGRPNTPRSTSSQMSSAAGIWMPDPAADTATRLMPSTRPPGSVHNVTPPIA